MIGSFLMSRVRFFRQFYFVGSNPKAATLSGIKVPRLTVMGFTIMGTLAGLAGTLLASRLSNAVVLAGTGVELRAITAALMGGASLSGGVVDCPGCVPWGSIYGLDSKYDDYFARAGFLAEHSRCGLYLIAIGIDQFGQNRK